MENFMEIKGKLKVFLVDPAIIVRAWGDWKLCWTMQQHLMSRSYMTVIVIVDCYKRRGNGLKQNLLMDQIAKLLIKSNYWLNLLWLIAARGKRKDSLHFKSQSSWHICWHIALVGFQEQKEKGFVFVQVEKLLIDTIVDWHYHLSVARGRRKESPLYQVKK